MKDFEFRVRGKNGVAVHEELSKAFTGWKGENNASYQPGQTVSNLTSEPNG